MQTTKGTVILDEIVKILGENRAAIGLTDNYPRATRYGIFYGPEQRFGSLPVVIIDGVAKDIELTATGFRGSFIFSVVMTICHITLDQATTVSRKESLERAEIIEGLFFDKPNLNGRVIHGYITSIDDGSVQIKNNFYFAHQLVWEGFSKERVQSGVPRN